MQDASYKLQDIRFKMQVTRYKIKDNCFSWKSWKGYAAPW